MAGIVLIGTVIAIYFLPEILAVVGSVAADTLIDDILKIIVDDVIDEIINDIESLTNENSKIVSLLVK